MAGDGGQLTLLEQIEVDLRDCVDAVLEQARARKPEDVANLLIAAEHLNLAILEVASRIASLRQPGA